MLLLLPKRSQTLTYGLSRRAGKAQNCTPSSDCLPSWPCPCHCHPPYHLLQRPRPHLQHGDRTGVPQMCPASGILGGHRRPQVAGETCIRWGPGHGAAARMAEGGRDASGPRRLHARAVSAPFGEPEGLGGQMGGAGEARTAGLRGP